MKSQRATATTGRKRSRSEADTGRRIGASFGRCLFFRRENRFRFSRRAGPSLGRWIGLNFWLDFGLSFCDSQSRAGRSLRPRRPATHVAFGPRRLQSLELRAGSAISEESPSSERSERRRRTPGEARPRTKPAALGGEWIVAFATFRSPALSPSGEAARGSGRQAELNRMGRRTRHCFCGSLSRAVRRQRRAATSRSSLLLSAGGELHRQDARAGSQGQT